MMLDIILPCTKMLPVLINVRLHAFYCTLTHPLHVAADVNDGHNTREKIKAHDPLLSTLLMHTYGDAPWRYTHTMPRQWGGKPRCTSHHHYKCIDALIL